MGHATLEVTGKITKLIKKIDGTPNAQNDLLILRLGLLRKKKESNF
jgi:hypothetical protein